ncbi:MAG: hypothetical protein ACFHX7_03380 [Pseudomonadota bacterium]
MAISLAKPWVPLTVDSVAQLPGHMGVFELGDSAGHIVLIGYAGGRSLFGLRGEIGAHLDSPDACLFRYEITTAYLTRFQELLMVHVANEGHIPAGNRLTELPRLGKLSLASGG